MKKRNIDYESFTAEQIFRFAEMAFLEIYEGIFNKKQSVFQAYLCDVIGWEMEVAEYVLKHIEQMSSLALQCWFGYLYVNGVDRKKIAKKLGYGKSRFQKKAMPKVTLQSFYPTFKLNKETALVYNSILKLIRFFREYISFDTFVYEKLSVEIINLLSPEKDKEHSLSFRGVNEIPSIIPKAPIAPVEIEEEVQEENFIQTQQLQDDEVKKDESTLLEKQLLG